MVPVPRAVRTYTSNGWQDIALQGPQGPPGGLTTLAYAEFNASVQITSTNENAPNDVVSTGPVVFDGLPVWVEMFVPFLQPPLGQILFCNLWEDAINRGRLCLVSDVSGTYTQYLPGLLKRRYTPAVGTHTLKLTAFGAASGGVIGAGGSYLPGFIRVTKDVTGGSPVGVPLVTSLPSSPIDGQEIYFLADATNSIVWHLRYRAASASGYKWEFLGGLALEHTLGAQTTTTVGTVWHDLATVGPTLTVPLAGTYDVDYRARFYNPPAASNAQIGVAIGAATPLDIAGATAAIASTQGYPMSDIVRRDYAAGNALRVRYAIAGGVGTYTYDLRHLRLTPVRVG
jgi:hypothetical protein